MSEDGGELSFPMPEKLPVIDEELKERAMDEAPVGITITDPSLPDNPLVYVNDSFERMTGYEAESVLGWNCRFLQGPESDPGTVATMREAVEEEKRVSVELKNYRADGSEFWNRVDIAPIRDGGGTVQYFVGFQTDVTARKRAEMAAERERRWLEHVLDRVGGLLQDVTASLVGATSRSEAEQAVCERVVAADPYVFAWVGELDYADDRITVREFAGEGTAADLSIPADSDDPVARAVETGDLQVAGDLDGRLHADVVPGDATLAAVPLSYLETLYGVLAVYAGTRDAFDERETVVLESLGRAVATAVGALEGRRVLVADDIAEAEFRVADDSVFAVALSRILECRVEHRGSTVRDDGSVVLFVTLGDADADAALSAARDCEEIVDATVLTDGAEELLLEVAVGPDSLVSFLAEQGAEIRSLTAEDGAARVRMTLAADSNVRALRDRLRERHPDCEMTAYRDREPDRAPRTRGEFVDDLRDRLTDRQLAALQKAYFGGYFDSTRGTTGERLAASMDITRSTFHQHLRAAERKLVGALLENR